MYHQFLRTLVVLSLLITSIAAQRIVALNQSTVESDQWIRVSVPNTGQQPDVAEFAGRPAIKLFDRTGASFYAIRPQLAAGERLEDELRPLEGSAEFVEHPAVYDNLFDVLPSMWIDGKPIPLRHTAIVESNAARRVVRCTYQEPGWYGRAWLYIYSDQAQVDFSCIASWTDRRDPRWFRPVRSITWRFGEAIRVPTAVAEGLDVSEDWRGAGRLRWNVPATKHGKVLGDSEIYRFRGSMLCAERGWNGKINTDGEPTAPRARLSAVCRDWAGHWGPFQAIPPIPENGVASAQDEADEFDQLLSTPSTMFAARRMYAHARRAGAAGHQPVFGHSPAGVAVSLHDPRQIERLLFSVSDDFMRPEHLRTESGNVIGLHNVPELATWNMRAHWGRSRGGTRTKPTETWPPQYSLGDDKSNGLTGRDNEHWSTMVPATYLLTGDYDLDYVMRGWVHIIQTNNNLWNPNSRLVDRGLGRLLRTFSSVYLCLDGWEGGLCRDVLEGLVRDADRRMIREGPVRHVCGLTFDNRGLVRDGVQQATMNVPFQSIAACGLWSAHVVLPSSSPQKDKACELALEVGGSLVQHAFYFEKGRAWAPYHLHYRDGGEAIPDVERVSGSWEVKGGASDGGSDWLANWAFGILPIVAEHGKTSVVRARAKLLISKVPTPASWFGARFWGVLPSGL